MEIKVLDCTLRDGGYYNDWDFPIDLVNSYLDSIAKSGVNYVELGLRQLNNNKYLGPHAYTTYEYINRLHLPEGPKYGVMIDAKTVLSSPHTQEECINLLFKDCNEESIDFVRVAAHFLEVQESLPMLKALKSKGYIVGLNIMQSSIRNSKELEDLSGHISSWSSYVDVLYFADSLGSMVTSDMERVYKSIAKNWKNEIGFHAHNNMGRAINNVNTAIDLGVTWVDSTITGMGRGAGNAETEYLLMESRFLEKNYYADDLFELVSTYFEPLKLKCGWGSSLYYYIGAKYGLHPTYVQELSTDITVNRSIIPKILNDLGKVKNPNSYSKDVLDKVKSKLSPKNNNPIYGDEIPTFMEGMEVLLVAQTNLSKSLKGAIEDYILKKNPTLISINQPSKDLKLNYDFVSASHNKKFREDESKYIDGKFKYIAPKNLFEGIPINIEYNYGILVSKGMFEYSKNFATIPFNLTIAYTIAFCMNAGANKISLVGFGGYESSEDPRQKEMQEFLRILSLQNIELISLNPTSFTIPEKSIYAI